MDGAALCAELTTMSPSPSVSSSSSSPSPVSATAVRMTTKEEEMQECPFQMAEPGRRLGNEGSWEGEKKEYTFTLKQGQ